MKTVAESKKAQNIGEYIIYMYQMEDLLRSYEFKLEDIRQYVVSHYPISDPEKESTLRWFAAISSQMQLEKITEKGHLATVQQDVEELAQLHWELLKTDKEYFDVYHHAKPHIINMILEAGEQSPGHEIQICLNGIYGLLLARLRGREIPDGFLEATEAFGQVLSYLNRVYQIRKFGR